MLAKSLSIYKLPLLSALLISLSYIPFYPWATLFSFIPLWIFILRSKSLKTVFYGSLITGTLLAAISSYWIFIAIFEFGQIPVLLALPLSLLFFLIAQLFIPLSSVCSFLIKKHFQLNKAYGLLVLATIFSLLQQFTPTPLPWFASTTFLQYQIPLYHFADLIGFAGLNSVLLLFNASLGYAYLYKKKYWALNTIILFFTLVSLGHFYGQAYKTSTVKNQKTLSMQIVQTGIGSVIDYKKYFINKPSKLQKNFNPRRQILELHKKETLKTIKPNSISLWPESALLNYANQNNPLSQNLNAFSKTHNISIIFGSWFFNQKHQAPQISLFFHSPKDTKSTLSYKKVKLVPFGETLPLQQYFPKFIQWIYTQIPSVGNFLAEKKPLIKTFQNINFGSQICYESLFPELSRDLSQQGAQILINVSNDSWYDSWFQPRQHLYTSFSRAIENRLPMVRATTTGISGAILANGNVLKLSPYKKGASWSHLYSIKYLQNPSPSFYAKHPYWFNYLLLIFLFSLLITKYKKNNCN
ncbi:MAG: apolipoprotein N-acyltransferase [Bdellovibrionaceae bacterium]|nr:apolipoprotein N-acyltransferase [Pseudobdellovibrionaceae bacterium]